MATQLAPEPAPERDWAAEIAEPMAEYARRAVDRLIGYVEADRARLLASVGEVSRG